MPSCAHSLRRLKRSFPKQAEGISSARIRGGERALTGEGREEKERQHKCAGLSNQGNGQRGECGLQPGNAHRKWAEGPGRDPAEELGFYPGHSRAGSSRPGRGGKYFSVTSPHRR